jgi:hypothetical protein
MALIDLIDSLNEFDILLQLFEDEKHHYGVFQRIQMRVKLYNKQAELTRTNHNVNKN